MLVSRWNKISRSENDSVDMFGEDQLYTVFVLEFGGQDLESFAISCFNEVKSILAQVRNCISCDKPKVYLQEI